MQDRPKWSIPIGSSACYLLFNIPHNYLCKTVKLAINSNKRECICNYTNNYPFLMVIKQ
ncbi:hypothetical protein Scep_014438 [Stephania cephalantha]|uniref:Uncharacterized protein n=1 Tax=Stephania cephalantha TaxID=152367 RepID=A0AAP0J0Z3_9MAGN